MQLWFGVLIALFVCFGVMLLRFNVAENTNISVTNTIRRQLASVTASRNNDAEFLEFFRNSILNLHYNNHNHLTDGSNWPPGGNAASMAGSRRIDNYAALVATCIQDGVQGHVIETGVWKGGASFVAAKVIELLGQAASRTVYLCDSFSGIPKAFKGGKSGINSQDSKAHNLEILNDNAVERVNHSAALFGLDMSHLKFEVGYFNESLPALVAREPSVRFSVVRLDGDTYFSTMDALSVLYPRLNAGGFIIIDDYIDWAGCREAVDEYRTTHGITEPIILVPHKTDELTRGVYWRKGPLTADMKQCVGGPAAAGLEGGQQNENTLLLRARGSYNPATMIDKPVGGPPGVPPLIGLRKDLKMCV